MNVVRLFTWIQRAEFYHKLHAEAVSLLPEAQGDQQWIDIGCGPGLVTRLAASRGYQALGIDLNPQMIAAAQRIAQHEGSSAVFRQGQVEAVANAAASVISAASLLAVLADPMAGLTTLWQSVRPGGTLLIIEPTAAMTVSHACHLLQNESLGKGKIGLYLWANARQGYTIDPSLYTRLQDAQLKYTALLHGLVGVWILQKAD
ncbi:MAG: methyltransferase domain-containing protein [Chloroflexota bacterium]